MSLGSTVAITALVIGSLAVANGPQGAGRTDRTDRTDRAGGATAAGGQCRQVSLRHAGNGWYVPSPATGDSGSPRCSLRFGDGRSGTSDGAIKALQRNINYCYRGALTVDGIYGPRTRAAVQRIQRQHGLTANGVYDARTRSAMRWREYHPKSGTWTARCYTPF